jgi:GST-like protein
MADGYVVYGAAGSGSVMVEAALTLLDLPYRVVEISIDPAQPEPDYGKVNPMRQSPALVLPRGELMTESSAILTWLADDHPEARLAPTMASLARPAFLRWMAFWSAAIYSLFWIRDDPARLTGHAEAGGEIWGEIRARTADRIAECWGVMDAGVDPGRYILGDDLTVLDVAVTVMSRWTPRRRRFYEVAPKMTEVVRRVDAEPRLRALWAARFPFEDGWEG